MPASDVDSAEWATGEDVEGALLWLYRGAELIPTLIGIERTTPYTAERRNDDGSVTQATGASNIHQLAAMGGVPLVAVDIADACDYDAETVDPKTWLLEQQRL